MAMLNVVTLHESNFRDPVATLRNIADEIENGEYGDVSCVAVAVFGDTLEVFGAGIDSEPSSVGMLLSAAHLKLAGLMITQGHE